MRIGRVLASGRRRLRYAGWSGHGVELACSVKKIDCIESCEVYCVSALLYLASQPTTAVHAESTLESGHSRCIHLGHAVSRSPERSAILDSYISNFVCFGGQRPIRYRPSTNDSAWLFVSIPRASIMATLHRRSWHNCDWHVIRQNSRTSCNPSCMAEGAHKLNICK